MSNKQTFDLDNQPGIITGPVPQSAVKRAAEALSLDPNHVLEMRITGKEVHVTTTIENVDGAKVGGKIGGYLKHDYTRPVVPDEEAMSPSEYYGSRVKAASNLLVDIEELAKIRAVAPGQDRMYLRMATMLAYVGATEEQITDFAQQVAKGSQQ